MQRLAVLVLLLAITAAAADKPAEKKAACTPVVSAPTKAEVDSFMQKTFGWDPSMKWTVADIRPAPHVSGLSEVDVAVEGQGSLTLFVTPDGKHAFVSPPLDFGADPFAANRAVLQKEAVGASRGPADSPITIVEFSDFQCPHCKAAQPTLDRLLTDTHARLIYEEFPLPMHEWAEKAAKYAECVNQIKPAIFFKYAQAIFDYQTEINAQNADERLKTLASEAGVDGNQIQQCASQPGIDYRVKQSMELGKKLGVNATPTIFVNGRMINGLSNIPYDTLKQIVEYMGKQGNTAATAASKPGE